MENYLFLKDLFCPIDMLGKGCVLEPLLVKMSLENSFFKNRKC
jgi:hypothetical protein